jgi:hypothetical protein
MTRLLCSGNGRDGQAAQQFDDALAIDREVQRLPHPHVIDGVPPKIRFALDSPLEGDGFEPSVPRRGQHFSRLPRSSVPGLLFL